MDMKVASPSLVVSPHPILAQAGRQIYTAEFLPGETIADFLDRQGVKLGMQPWLLAVDGHPVPREWWGRVRPKPGTLITLRALVQKGGGGGGKNPLQTVLSIALMVAAPGIGAAIGNAIGLSGTAFSIFGQAFSWGQIIGGMVSIAGNMIISGLGDAPQQAMTQASGRYSEDQVSPTYALSGGSNRLRPFEPMPLLFGRHRIYPDLGAKSWTEFEGEDQYLYQIFNFGLTDMVLDEFKIGATPIENYQDVDIVQAGADGKVANWPSNVDSTAGASLTYAVGWISRTSGINATALAVDIQGSLYAAGSSGLSAATCVHEIEYRAVGASTWLPFVPDVKQYYTYYWSRGYTSTDGDGNTSWVQLDYGSTVAGDHVEGAAAGTLNGKATVWHWRPYSDIAQTTGGSPDYTKPLRAPAPPITYTTDTHTLSITNSTRKPIRRTIKRTVPDGQYEVRIRRVTADSTSATNASEFSWSTLRTYQTDTTDYTGQRRVGLKIKASGQLQGQVDQFSAVATSWESVWDSTANDWGVAHNSNPAWAYLRFCRGKRIDGKLIYGLGLDDARIDIAGLKVWAAWCDLHGLTFNAVFDTQRSRADILDLIAACGRASRTWATGKIGVVWDAEDQPEVGVFTMSNIVASSFSITYATEKLADEIVGNFINPDKDWQQDQVRVTVPGFPVGYVPTNPATVEIFGCTDKAMSGKIINLRAAAQRYHRRSIQWESDFEGLVAQRGDVVRLSHDLTQWGTSGRLVGATDTVLTLDRPVSYASGTPYIGVRHPDGTWFIRAVQAFTGEAMSVTLTAPLTFTDGALTYNAGSDPRGPVIDYLYVFDPQATPGKKIKITGVPKVTNAGARLQFLARDESPDYYAAESGAFTWAPPVNLSQPLPQITAIDVTEEWTLVGNSYAVKLVVTWDVIGAFDHAVVRFGYENEPLRLVDSTRAMRSEILVPDHGSARIEVSVLDGVGRMDPLYGIAATTHTIAGKDIAVSDVTSFTAQPGSNGLVVFRWNMVADPDYKGTEIRYNPPGDINWDNASTVSIATRGTQITTGIVPPGSWTFLARHHDACSPANLSQTVATASATVNNPNYIVSQRDEADWWETGILTNLLVHQPSRSLVLAGQSLAQAAGWSAFDTAGYNLAPQGTYDTPETDVGRDAFLRVYGILYSKLLPGATGISDPDTQINVKLAGGAYAGLAPWDIGTVTGRYYKWRIVVDRDEGHCRVYNFQPTLDARYDSQSASAVAVPATGLSITFPNSFFSQPAIITQAVGAGDFTTQISAQNKNSFTVFVRTGATAVAGSINWRADGAFSA